MYEVTHIPNGQAQGMQDSVAFNLRPVKIAYFVDIDDLDTFVAISRFCCTQWGGINHFIIPVRPDGIPPFFMQVLRVHHPDTIVGAAIVHKVVQDEFCAKELPTIAIQEWQDFLQWDQTLHLLALYYNGGTPVRQLVTHSNPYPVGSLEHACVLAAFGEIWPGQEDGYWDMFMEQPIELDSTGEQFISDQLTRETLESVVNLTSSKIGFQYVGSLLPKVHFDIVIASNTLALCAFWCQRAIENMTSYSSVEHTRRTLIVPPSLFEQDDFRHLLFGTVRPKLIHPFRSSTLDLNFLASGDQRDAIRSCLERSRANNDIEPFVGDFTITVSLGETSDEKHSKRHAAGDPLNYAFNMQPRLPSRYRESADAVSLRQVQLREGRNDLYSPARSIAISSMAEVMLDIQTNYWSRYPRNTAVAQRIHPHSAFSDYGLSMHVGATSNEALWQLNLPSEAQALDMFFQTAGYNTRRGTVSQRGHALIDLMGGIDECQFLRRREVLDILDKLAVKTTNKLSQDIVSQLLARMQENDATTQTREELADVVRDVLTQTDVPLAIQRRCTTVEALRREPALRQFWRDIVLILDQLVRRSVVFRGFNVKCDNCGTPTWYPFNTVQETVQCPGCFTTFPLSVMVDGGAERPLEYTLNTVVNRAMDQDVLGPVILLAKLAKEKRPIYGQTIGLEIGNRSKPNAGEFDVVFVKDQCVYAGECKMGAELKEKDIRLAELAYEIGCSGFYFASLAHFNDESHRLIDEFKTKASTFNKSFEITVYEESDFLNSGVE